MATRTEMLWDACENYLAAAGLELDDLDVAGGGPRVARVTVPARCRCGVAGGGRGGGDGEGAARGRDGRRAGGRNV